MEALMKANNGHALGYGDDPWTEEAAHKVKEQFSRPCEALFVFNGTGSNTMALQIMTRPYHILFLFYNLFVKVGAFSTKCNETSLK